MGLFYKVLAFLGGYFNGTPLKISRRTHSILVWLSHFTVMLEQRARKSSSASQPNKSGLTGLRQSSWIFSTFPSYSFTTLWYIYWYSMILLRDSAVACGTNSFVSLMTIYHTRYKWLSMRRKYDKLCILFKLHHGFIFHWMTNKRVFIPRCCINHIKAEPWKIIWEFRLE